MKTIAILTSGGDAPGMNAAIRAITRSALDQGMTVFGVRHGFQGLIEDQIRPLNARDVGGIIHLGGTFLGSARSKEFREERGRSKALHNLSSHGIEGLVVIGGNGSQTGSYTLSKLGFPVVGVASTIDNDLFGTNVTIGSDTAVNVTLEAIDHLRTTGSSHNRAFLVETMGRNCGYLALMSGIISGAEMTLIPEVDVSPEEVALAVTEAYARGKTHAIVVVSEGAKLPAIALKEKLNAMKLDVDLRVTVLGHVQRGGGPSAWDRLIAARFGVSAVERLLAGKSGVMVALCAREIADVPMEEAGSRQRAPDMEYYRMSRMLAK